MFMVVLAAARNVGGALAPFARSSTKRLMARRSAARSVARARCTLRMRF